MAILTNKRVMRIEGDGTPGKTKVLLDGMDVSRFVRKININYRAGYATDVILTCRGFVEIPDELRALVSVEIDDKKG